MNGDRQVDVDGLLSPLRDEQAGAGDALSIDRGRVVARMMSVAKAFPRERTRRRLAMAASAATIVLALGVARWVRNAPVANDREVALSSLAGEVTWQGTRAMRLASGQSATIEAVGDVMTNVPGRARLGGPSGVESELGMDTHVGLDSLAGHDASVRLFNGKVHCRVRRPAPSDTFSVVTRDVHVDVRGAVFTVETSGDGVVSVRVDEGVVVIRQPGGEVTLTAPQSWTNARPAELVRPGATAEPPPRATPAPPPRRVGLPAPRGTLDEETRLLRSGLASERNGDLAGATASLDRLLARFPQSPLAPDARAARLRIRARQRAVP